MTQVLSTSYFGSWPEVALVHCCILIGRTQLYLHKLGKNEVHFERNKSNWLESYPKSHHYSRKRSDSKINSTSIPEIAKKPLEEVQQILCDNSLPIEIQSSLKCGQSEHNLRAKRIIKCIPSETNQKITSYFVDRKFSRPSIRKDKFSSLINPIEQPRNCASESILLEPEVPGKHLLVTDPVIENAVNDNSGASQILVSNPTRTEEGVEVPSWRTRIYSGKYIIEGTEDLSDKVFEERHLKHETSEKKRKKRDEKCLEEQERLGKLSRTTTSSNHPKKKVLHVEILESDPKCAFGYVIPDIPHEDFDLPSEFFTLRRMRQRKSNKTDLSESESSILSSTKFIKLKKTFTADGFQ